MEPNENQQEDGKKAKVSLKEASKDADVCYKTQKNFRREAEKSLMRRSANQFICLYKQNVVAIVGNC
jgi:hypothetical protein